MIRTLAGILFLCVFQSAFSNEKLCEEEAEIEAFVLSYFESWNTKDWASDAYRNHFHPQAVIIFGDKGSPRHNYNVDEFIASQKKSKTSLREYPTTIEIICELEGAAAVVGWQLFDGRKIKKTGVDIFTLVNTKSGKTPSEKTPAGNWKIVSLYWFQDSSLIPLR